ncbi:hypothetical protein Kpol_1002p10 [Vanderwaltozyma polyspora DSM 70294]|uniref:Sister chromatid cohesion protein PDS5 n=1 Tax=Vanderwaltozyma polyspora (strain ATCC 22028 / DSM 70294 / BCRC 21397 / CBS 2163 / NBRC 10782 / NRRL Y-8283 / UCD 57-17) TaxID=436907 RepID=A7TE43_VANPO|nr:uncharacterized protein Kpol_1002p10 [Vanderwaltozyma polyspora DSM 70294]EDO19365.1 hypothetical protein Kpol_1002p10 [Vanderwaltozyma polyspora DSM 70294]
MVQKAKLRFKKPILSSSENPISLDELLSRLSNLHEELSTSDQEQTDLDSLSGYCADLVNRKLLRHKDSGVRAFTACCLSDILRLYAPDAPYTDTQLTDIFKLFLFEFEELGDSENSYYLQQTYLITRLLEYRSIVLLADLPSANQLLQDLFTIFYSDSRTYNSKLYKVIGGILGEVISEFDIVPISVLKIIFNRFLTHDIKNIPKGLGVASNSAYEINLILCDTYISRMSRHFTRYYSEVLYELSNDENSHHESPREISRSLEKLHRLTIRLWETIPDIVSPVMGFIYHELCSEKDLLRLKATQFVGSILASDSQINFATTYKDVFNAWVTKIADINADVRVQWVETIPDILASRDDISEEISKGLSKTLIDTDNQVRKASVLVFDTVPVQILWNNIKNLSVYNSLLHLTREKNKDVRELCISTVTKFYSKSLKNVTRSTENKDTWDVIDKIPSSLFNLYYINDLHINEQVDKVVFESLLSLDIDDKKRVERLLEVISKFDKKAFSSFFAFNKRQVQMSIALSKYVEFCEIINDNGSTIDSNLLVDANAKLPKLIEWLATGLSDPVKGIAALEAIKELNDRRIYYLIKTCISSDVTFQSWKNSFKELSNKLNDSSLLRKHNIKAVSTIVPKEIARQFIILIYRSSPLIYNVSNITQFLNTADGEYLELKRKLLDNISEINPSLLKGQVKMLVDFVKKHNTLDEDDASLPFSEVLKTLYKIGKSMPNEIMFSESFFVDKLEDYAINGTTLVSKYATKLISLMPNSADVLTTIRAMIMPLDIKKAERFTSNIVVLSEIFKYCPRVLDEDSTEIVSYLIKEVLLSNEVVGDEDIETDWVDDKLLYTSRYNALSAKLASLKLFTNKLKSIAHEADKDDITNAFIKKTMKLFFYLIASGGELISENNKEFYPTPSNYQTRLRCCAGLQLLKLARIPELNEFIKPSDIIKLINIVEDESLPVRRTFLNQLKDFISNELISIKFLPLIFFTAYEPDQDVKTVTKTWINFTFGKEAFKKGTYFERALPRLIHAISHHPDIVEAFENQDDSFLSAMTTAIDYLMFYFDSIATQENFSLLYYLSERIKNYEDKVISEDTDEIEISRKENSKRMYIIGELSQMILIQFKEKKAWQHSAYPGKLNLPGDLFQPFATIKEAQASFKTYISEKSSEKLQANIKTKVGRLVYSSQTQRQRAQKRMLASEYQSGSKKKATRRSDRKSRHKGFTDDENSDDDDDSEIDDDEVYKPSGGRSSSNTGMRKNLRERKKIDYKDDDDNDDDAVEYDSLI